MLFTAYKHAAAGRGSVGVRFPRGTGFGVPLDEPLTEIPIGVSETLREGGDLAIVAYGHPVNAALAAAELLSADGIEATVIDARFAKPLDADRLLALAARIPRIVTVEEHVVAGGFGSAVAELLQERGAPADIEMIGIPDEHVDHGAQSLWRHHYGLDAEGIARKIRARWPQAVRDAARERSAS
jgi:1-deoxy-D-xylulose-5-phosphate synthase